MAISALSQGIYQLKNEGVSQKLSKNSDFNHVSVVLNVHLLRSYCSDSPQLCMGKSNNHYSQYFRIHKVYQEFTFDLQTLQKQSRDGCPIVFLFVSIQGVEN